MKAIILAAGVGKRLQQFLKDEPKCLLRFNGKSLLRRLIDGLAKSGVTNIVVVVGYQKEKIFNELQDLNDDINIKYVVNDDYMIGSIISLWKAKAELDDDAIIMDADVLCDNKLIERLVSSSKKSCFLMDKDFVDTGVEQKLGVVNGKVMTITKEQLDGQFDLVGEAVGFLKLCKEDASFLSKELANVVDSGIDNCEHEEVYDKILRSCDVSYETVNSLSWIEIDFQEDVEKAEAMIKSGIEA